MDSVPVGRFVNYRAKAALSLTVTINTRTVFAIPNILPQVLGMVNCLTVHVEI